MKASRVILAASATAVLSLAFTSSASANDITVETAVDEAFVNNSSCSLREAIGVANADAGPANGCAAASGVDAISFDPSVTGPIQLTADAAHGGDANHGDLLIMSSVSIDGPGMDEMTIDAPTGGRVFFVTSGASQVEISGLTVQGGEISEDDQARGGGIFSDAGTLNLTDVKVADNSVVATGATVDQDTFASGGGIYQSGALILDHSIVSGNVSTANNALATDAEAVAQGGGISSASPTTIMDSTIENNTAEARDQQGSTLGNAARTFGGGIDSVGALTVTRSTISNNAGEPLSDEGAAFAWGAGLRHASGNATIELSTVTANTNAPAGVDAGSSIQDGGAIISFGGTVNLQSSTISGNGPGNAALTDAGANLAVAFATSFTLNNTIVANPLGTASGNCDGSVTSSGFNLESDDDCDLNQASDQVSTDPLLDLLTDNGGPTETLLPGTGSPALDAGSSAGQTDATHDQRGLLRPVDALEFANAADGSDVGAVEVQAPPIPTLTATDPVSPSKTESAPNVIGSAGTTGPEGATQLAFYSDSACTSELTTRPPAGFDTTGLQVDVPPNATTTIYAKADSDYTTQSACSSSLASDGSVTYTHDSLGPVMTIDSGPADPGDHTPTFTFHGTDLSPPIAYECSVDTGTPSFSPCTSPFTAGSLPDGSYTFRVTGQDSLLNPIGTASQAFTIATPVPAPPAPPAKKKKCKKAKKKAASAAKKCKKKKKK